MFVKFLENVRTIRTDGLRIEQRTVRFRIHQCQSLCRGSPRMGTQVQSALAWTRAGRRLRSHRRVVWIFTTRLRERRGEGSDDNVVNPSGEILCVLHFRSGFRRFGRVNGVYAADPIVSLLFDDRRSFTVYTSPYQSYCDRNLHRTFISPSTTCHSCHKTRAYSQ